jgi:hypothetical protein
MHTHTPRTQVLEKVVDALCTVIAPLPFQKKQCHAIVGAWHRYSLPLASIWQEKPICLHHVLVRACRPHPSSCCAAHLDEIAQAIENGLDPSQACAKIGMCPAQALLGGKGPIGGKGPMCLMCTTVRAEGSLVATVFKLICVESVVVTVCTVMCR